MEYVNGITFPSILYVLVEGEKKENESILPEHIFTIKTNSTSDKMYSVLTQF